MNNIVVPNVVRLLELFRKEDMIVIYLSLDKDGIISQISPSKARMGIGNWWERKAREFVVTKYSSGAFATSSLDNILREFGINSTLTVVNGMV